jgi:CBS domain-containing protein
MVDAQSQVVLKNISSIGVGDPENGGIRIMLAKDIMTKDVITVDPSTTVRQLAILLTKNNISGVPVCDKRGKIVGMVTQADIVGKKGKHVRAIMSKKIIHVNAETPVEKVAITLTTHRIKRVPVMRGEQLLGIVSRADIVGAIAMGKHIALHVPIYDL